ncbi:TIGR03089 family protein [Cellulomonas gilvus]|uniref:AMP-dependent synthetase and ligase n=1 Tax=Cellulomonas gilvus (strain ATCC 13127 / NRRL B-14078) TaxID=593907 RepID=F8A186_CELGA|nr:TIGR03089 family protein [Cellulomonas gilvus]AEI11633.1 AMP-dependent synthetase and ligase [Cellulomonas gilvus ATCC 13127]
MTGADSPNPPAVPVDAAALLRGLLLDPGRPRLTWYAAGGERVELSGAVLDNWVSKTTNLLVEELDAGPGTVVALDLPPHWRTALWALATWRTGATLAWGADPGADVLVTAAPPAAAHAQLVVVALPALARRAVVDLPAGAVDAAAAVMTYGDTIGWVPPTEPQRTALVGTADGPVPHGELAGWWSGARPERLLLGPQPSADWLRSVAGTLAAGGSLVLVDADEAGRLHGDRDALERLTQSERITAQDLGTAPTAHA